MSASIQQASARLSKRLLRTVTKPQWQIREIIRLALFEEMDRDKSVHLLGEEIDKFEGSYNVTGRLGNVFPGRVIDTPITEAGFTGLAVGAAYTGLVKPVVEFMSFNFSMQAIDHIVNSAAKMLYMTHGEINVPIVFRGLNGSGYGVGAQHSQCYAAWFSAIPGLKVVSPFDAWDYKSLLKAAIRDPNPVIVLEHELMYSEMVELDEKLIDPEFVAPLGKARVMRQGKHCTIIAHGIAVQYALEAAKVAEENNVSCEVINLCSLRPLDLATIIESVKKTHRVAVVEEGFPHCGIGAEISALISEHAFHYLDAPVVRVTGADVPMPYSKPLESIALPNSQCVLEAIQKVSYVTF